MPLRKLSGRAGAMVVVVAALCALAMSASVVAYFLSGVAQGRVINGAWMTLAVASVIAMAAAAV